ncbi:transposase [Polaribacter sp.]|uniref:transposase n=1 Tax=Polaribacter sp. TaxID=1920175 RepID=UPI003F4BF77D
MQKIPRCLVQNCKDCLLKSRCYKSKTNRIIVLNYNLIPLKSQVKKSLTSQRVIAKRKQCYWDVGAIFGNIKQNKNLK